MAMMFSVAFLSQFDAVGQTTCEECHVGNGCGGDANAAGDCSFAAADGSSTTGNGAAVLCSGIASGEASFAAVDGVSSGFESAAIGDKTNSRASYSIAIGSRVEVESTATNSIILGRGSTIMENDIENSIMFGMNSDVPTVFIGNSGGTSGSYGNVGIGNITDDAESLLHVRDQIRVGYDSEDNGSIIFNNSTNSNTVGFQSGVSTANQLYTLPLAYGSDGDVLTYSTTGNQLSWEDPATPIVDRPLFRWGTNTTTSVMEMDINCRLGIGTATPDGRLDVNGSLFAGLSTTAASPPTGPGNNVKILATGELIEYTSSGNHKSSIEDIQFDKEAFLSLRPVDFKWKDAFGGGQDIGLIAEEVEQLMPNMVNYHYKHTYVDAATGEMLRDSIGNLVLDTTQLQPWGVDYRKISVYLLALAKEQDSLLNNMNDRLSTVESVMQNCCEVEPSYRIADENNNDSIREKASLNVYPNPNDGNFTINYRLNEGEIGKLFLLTVSGDKMLLSNDVREIGREDFNINGPSGVYHVILESDGGEILKSMKVVIVH
jgi:hypothetical protein